MADHAAARLAEHGRQQLGEQLRTVAILYEDDCEVVYLRDDLREEYTPEAYESVAELLKVSDPAGTATDDLPVGERKALVHYHDGGFVFQFPRENCHSIVFSVESDVGSKLESFIRTYRNKL